MQSAGFSLVILFGLIFLVMNVATFVVYWIDKHRARHQHHHHHHKRRIPESVLLTMSALGGGLGAFAAMRIFHHKTNHRKFLYLVPTLMITQVALILWAMIAID